MSQQFKEQQLFWEKDSEGKNAIYKNISEIKINPNFSRNLAILKMIDVTAISASFQERSDNFYPLAWVLFDSSNKLNFFGVYARDVEEIESEEEVSICLRKSFWSKNSAAQAYKASSNAQDYMKTHLLSEKHIISNNMFCRRKDCPEILSLVSELLSYMKQGIKVEELNFCWLNPSDEFDFEFLRFYLQSGGMDYNFGYSSYQVKCDLLKNWSLKWFKYFTQFNPKTEFVSEKSIKFNYQLSLINYFNLFLNIL